MEWNRQKWSCILFLIVFPPLGIYWLWKYHISWTKNLRVGITIVSAVWFFALLGIAATTSPKLEKIALLGDELKIGIGETAEIRAVVEPEGAKLSGLQAWSSEKTAEFLINREDKPGELVCKLTAQKEGTVTVMLHCGEVQSNVIHVRVIDKDQLARQAKAVEQQIESIGAVSLRSEEAIISARRAYDALNEDASPLVANLDDLVQAEKALQELQDKAWQRADEARKRIEAIGEVSLESEPAIENVRKYYDSLPTEVQQLVENYSDLETAEQVFQQKKAAAEKEAEQSIVEPPKEAKKGSETESRTKSEDSGNSDSSGGEVYWTPNGKKYHKSEGCPTLSRSKVIRSGTISQAGGRDLCKVCG